MRTFAATWVVATVVLLIGVGLGQRAFGAAALGLMLVVLVPTLAMLRWLGLPTLPRAPTQRGAFALAIVGALATLVALYLIFGRPGALVAIGAVAAAVTWRVRARLTGTDARFALAFGAIAAVAGLGAEWLGTETVSWAALQLPVTTLALLGGWGLFRASELSSLPVASALVVASVPGAAARAALLGAAIAVPWALVNVAAGAAARDTWVHLPWQALAAAQPAIAEEAWARVFLIAVLYMALRRVASPNAALLGAILVAGYWFAWLHVHELSLSALINMAVAGTLFSLPLTFLWLRRGLEAAIAFHFVMDATRFLFAYLANTGTV